MYFKNLFQFYFGSGEFSHNNNTYSKSFDLFIYILGKISFTEYK